MRVVLSRKRDDSVARRVAYWAYSLGVVAGGWSSQSGTGEYERGVYLNWWPRPYVLGRQRHLWFHLPRYGHAFYPVFGDWCGKCTPWPCCGAIDEPHLPDCEEA